MEFPGERQGQDAHPLQIRGQRLHFSTRVRQVSLPYFAGDNAATLDADLQPFERFCNLPQGIVGRIQAVEPTRVILFIEAFRPQEQVEVAKRTMNFARAVIRSPDRRREGRHRAGGRRGIARRVRTPAGLTFIDGPCGLKSQTILQLNGSKVSGFFDQGDKT